MLSGVADVVTIDATFDEARPDRDALSLEFRFRDASARYVPSMTPLTGARGVGRATLEDFDLTVDAAQVDLGRAGRIDMGASSFYAEGFGKDDIPVASVKLNATGPSSAELALIDQEPLDLVSKSGIDPATVSGRATAQIRLDLPLLADLKTEEIKIGVEAQLRDFAMAEPSRGMRVSGPLLRLSANDAAVRAQAAGAMVDGAPVDFTFDQRFARSTGAADPDSSLRARLRATPALLDRIGLDGSMLSGPGASTEIDLRLANGEIAGFRARADITDQQFLFDALGWRKRAGVGGLVEVTGGRGPNGALRIDRVSVSGPGYSADGTVTLDAAGGIREARFDRVLFGEWNDFGVRYWRDDQGRRRLDLTGARLDLRVALERALRGSDGPSAPVDPGAPVTILGLRLERVYLDQDLALFGLEGVVTARGNSVLGANASAKVNGSADTKVLLERRGPQVALQVSAPDAGAMGRALDLYDSAFGGALRIDATVMPDATPVAINGMLTIDDVVIHNAPSMARILSAGTLIGLLDELEGGGIPFNRVEMPFSGDGKRWYVNDGVAFGRSIGLTLAGVYDRPRDALSMKGTVSPAYAINGALSNVPVLGDIITGGRGQGVFGVSFTVRGEADRPSIGVNPLSVFAPGVFRRLIDSIFSGGAPTNPNRP